MVQVFDQIFRVDGPPQNFEEVHLLPSAFKDIDYGCLAGENAEQAPAMERCLNQGILARIRNCCYWITMPEPNSVRFGG